VNAQASQVTRVRIRPPGAGGPAEADVAQAQEAREQALSWEEALARATAPGAPFEIVQAQVGGQTLRVFERTPASLRALFDTARGRNGQLFLVYEDERWTFGQVMAQVDALGALLVSRFGVRRGDRVAIAMRNYPEWITAFAAVASVGAIAVCLNAWWTADELAYGLEDSGTKVLVADLERAERAAPAAARLGTAVLVVRSGSAPLPAGALRMEEILLPDTALPQVEVGLDDDATILYTSGTTGRPKGAVSTHRAVLSALMAFGCRAFIARLMAPPAEPHPFPTAFILTVPLFHVTGLVPVMLSCFASGTKLVMMYKWSPERALELIERERVTQFVGVPTMTWDLLESPDFARRDTSSLLNVGGGGAPAPPELVTRVDRSFRRGRPNIGYGMTETNAYGPQNSGDDYVRKPRSAGRAVPILEIRVTDPEGRPLPVGEAGEIWFRGPNLIRGYWGKPEATAQTIVDGWLRSGDIGRIDAEGFVTVEDRAKDMVLRAGENVYCAEVEAAIYEHPDVYEAAVFGVPHPRLGEEVAASVMPKPGRTLDADSLRAHLAPRIAPFKIPTRIEIRASALPRNASGKILKRELRDALVEAGS
jgi:long-chain acyl-CoA synthetase